MIRFGLLAVLLLTTCLACSSGGTDKPQPTDGDSAVGAWEEALPAGSGAFESDWKPGQFPMGITPVAGWNGDLWMIGARAAWSSSDGLTWTQHEDKTELPAGRIYQTYAFFRDSLWMFGGLENPSLAVVGNATFKNDIWRSEDGVEWAEIGEAPWSARGGAAVVAFQDKLWLFGGGNHAADDAAMDGYLNDVWSSDDGETWTQVTDNAPWSARAYPRIRIMDDVLYLIGGQGQPNVWSSADGATWTELTGDTGWGNRFDYGAEVLNGKLWVFGGWIDDSRNPQRDVWTSKDGASWTQEADAPWSPRDPIATVLRDKILIFSGKATALPTTWSGDLWTLSAADPQ